MDYNVILHKKFIQDKGLKAAGLNDIWNGGYALEWEMDNTFLQNILPQVKDYLVFAVSDILDWVKNEQLELEYFIEPPSESSSNKAFNKQLASGPEVDLKKHHGKKWPLIIKKSEPRPLGLPSTFFSEGNQTNNFVTNTKISCRVLKDKSIFLSSEGLVFPCCWTAFPLNTYWDNHDSLQIRELLEKTGGKQGIDIRHRSLKQIIEGDFFTTIAKSWESPCAKDGKQVACATQCGVDLERLSDENIIY